jgi:KipI family sensor histidine kinase inhibitor
LLDLIEPPGIGVFECRQALWRAAREQPPPGLSECVPGYTTLLFEFHPGQGNEHHLKNWFERHWHSAAEVPCGVAGRQHAIPVRYHGPDLEQVADHAKLLVAEVIERHSAPEYRVDLIGFAPGFPYLSGLDPLLATPRLTQPRLRVEAGSVAIGGPHTGIYSRPGPGGWNIVGHTDVTLFDPATARCLLAPGDRIRFLPK